MSRDRHYHVHLTEKERKVMQHFRRKSSCVTQRKRFDVILNADEGRYGCDLTYETIAAKSGVCSTTVIKVLRVFCKEGLEKAIVLERNPKSDVTRLKATGDVEAKIIAKACTNPPEGRVRWTIRMLADASEIFESLKDKLKAWNDDYDQNPTPISRQFTLDDARTKLRRLYPNVEDYRKQRDARQQAKQFKHSNTSDDEASEE